MLHLFYVIDRPFTIYSDSGSDAYYESGPFLYDSNIEAWSLNMLFPYMIRRVTAMVELNGDERLDYLLARI